MEPEPSEPDPPAAAGVKKGYAYQHACVWAAQLELWAEESGVSSVYRNTDWRRREKNEDMKKSQKKFWREAVYKDFL